MDMLVSQAALPPKGLPLIFKYQLSLEHQYPSVGPNPPRMVPSFCWTLHPVQPEIWKGLRVAQNNLKVTFRVKFTRPDLGNRSLLPPPR